MSKIMKALEKAEMAERRVNGKDGSLERSEENFFWFEGSPQSAPEYRC